MKSNQQNANIFIQPYQRTGASTLTERTSKTGEPQTPGFTQPDSTKCKPITKKIDTAIFAPLSKLEQTVYSFKKQETAVFQPILKQETGVFKPINKQETFNPIKKQNTSIYTPIRKQNTAIFEPIKKQGSQTQTSIQSVLANIEPSLQSTSAITQLQIKSETDKVSAQEFIIEQDNDESSYAVAQISDRGQQAKQGDYIAYPLEYNNEVEMFKAISLEPQSVQKNQTDRLVAESTASKYTDDFEEVQNDESKGSSQEDSEKLMLMQDNMLAQTTELSQSKTSKEQNSSDEVGSNKESSKKDSIFDNQKVPETDQNKALSKLSSSGFENGQPFQLENDYESEEYSAPQESIKDISVSQGDLLKKLDFVADQNKGLSELTNRQEISNIQNPSNMKSETYTSFHSTSNNQITSRISQQMINAGQQLVSNQQNPEHKPSESYTSINSSSKNASRISQQRKNSQAEISEKASNKSKQSQNQPNSSSASILSKQKTNEDKSDGGISFQLDLSNLDQKSIKILISLLVVLIQQSKTVVEFFKEIIYEQSVQIDNKKHILLVMNQDEFFSFLCQQGIRKKATEHENLVDLLELSSMLSGILIVDKLDCAIQMMMSNQELMEALKQDLKEAEAVSIRDSPNQKSPGRPKLKNTLSKPFSEM